MKYAKMYPILAMMMVLTTSSFFGSCKKDEAESEPVVEVNHLAKLGTEFEKAKNDYRKALNTIQVWGSSEDSAAIEVAATQAKNAYKADFDKMVSDHEKAFASTGVGIDSLKAPLNMPYELTETVTIATEAWFTFREDRRYGMRLDSAKAKNTAAVNAAIHSGVLSATETIKGNFKK